MTFKDLKAQLSKIQPSTEDSKVFERLRNKPFWIWDQKEHRLEDIRTKGKCCFNHIISCPRKDKKEMPLFDYEKIIYDALLDSDFYNPLHQNFKQKHLWIKKATGLGITEFMLRFMAWLCVKDDSYRNSQMCIVTGPNIDMAIKLIKRLKQLFETKLEVYFQNKETVLELNGCTIEAYPSNHLDAYRALDNPKFILLDEGDHFRKGEQDDVRDVSERYIAKSDPFIVMISTPDAPDGLFAKIESEPEETCLYKRLKMDYTYGLDKIYTREEIEKAKKSPSFEREYNLKYLGKIGNFFNIEDIDAAITSDEEYNPDIPNREAITVMGIDTGWASSYFAIVITSWVNFKVYVYYASHFKNPKVNEMLNLVCDLRQRYLVDKILVDGSDPAFIYQLKERLREFPVDYHQVDKEKYQYMIVEPTTFTKQQYEFLVHDKALMEDKALKIHPRFSDLIIGLKSAYMEDTTFNKDRSANNDLLDALSECLSKFKPKTVNII